MTPTLRLTPHRLARGQAARFVSAWLLVLALLGAQGLGLWHRLAHDPHGAGIGAVEASRTTLPFGHAADDLPSCQAFDHLALADLLAVAAAILATAAIALATGAPQVAGIATACPRHYSARAPPAA